MVLNCVYHVNMSPSLCTACRKHNIQWMVYTSTYNVVFAGQMIENGDDSTPYLPPDKVLSLITSGHGY